MLSPGQRHRLKVEMRQKLEQQQAVAIADGESMYYKRVPLTRMPHGSKG